MPIADYKTTTTTPVAQEPDLPKYETALIDNRDSDISGLIQYIDGSKWQVEYYSQVLGANDGVQVFDTAIPDALQQYTLIKDFIIHVDSPLTPEAYSSQNTITATGSGKYYNNFPPNIGDGFTAKLINNNVGIFSITDVKRATYNKETIYEISYSLTSIVLTGSSKLNSLINKVVRTYYYDKESYRSNGNKLLTPKEFNTNVTFKALFSTMAVNFFKDFIDPATSMLIVPGQQERIYDNGVSEFLFKIITTDIVPNISEIYRPSINDDYIKQYNIWDVLANRNFNDLFSCNRNLKPTSLLAIKADSSYNKILYHGINSIMYPTIPDLTTETGVPIGVSSLVSSLSTTTSGNKNINVSFNNTDTVSTINYLPDIVALPTYVFSNSFYDDGSNLTIIESMCLDYLKGNPIDTAILNRLITNYNLWNRIDQFYYGPIVMLLIKSCLIDGGISI